MIEAKFIKRKILDPVISLEDILFSLSIEKI